MTRGGFFSICPPRFSVINIYVKKTENMRSTYNKAKEELMEGFY
ncbi:hypothetical protein COPCOM_02946 [Coprococcus comes ATCC 27758]|uniref:Uncharacterized protein n=1 Tax=Coprococcus comes ATCC 27758 TaxID=470146 RepID=C0BCQ4_9FIRM|nr:hypothetical protein COPCOM_02946 [Coprococcus comes ATCC 27758]